MKITFEVPRNWRVPAEEIAATIGDLAAKVDVTQIRFDPWDEMQVAQSLMNRGFPAERLVEEHGGVKAALRHG